MIVLGLTGSIGMGKSTAAAALESLGVRVCSSDALVHALLAEGGDGVAPVAALFPETKIHYAIDRKMLGDIVFHDQHKMKQLEHILHPLVVAGQQRFIDTARAQHAACVVLDIPLLFETGAEKRCDKVIVVSAPYCIQRCRVMARPDMTREKFQKILAAQMPDREKRRRADYVVQTGFGKTYSRWQLRRILRSLHA